MGYAAARGGLAAIEFAENLVQELRDGHPSSPLETDQVTGRLRLLVDRVMGEAGLWAPELAAQALRQAEGDVIEAVHLLRAFKSTLPRIGISEVVDADDMIPERRIVPAFREPGGPQILGRSTDYTARMLSTTRRETKPKVQPASGTLADETLDVIPPMQRMSDVLRDMQLLVDRRRTDDPEPFDITRMPA